jgi:oligopeptide transport system ATP-binding protein
MALACKPSVLIADEPTTALDVTIQADIMDLIHDLQLELDMAMILVTHDLGIAAEVSDRIQVMYAGEIVETGSKSDILKNPKHPYTWALLKSVPDISKGAKAELYYLKGSAMDLLECNEGCSFAPRCEYCMEICKKRKPLFENVDGDHSVSCWLTHNLAPDIECESIIEYSSGVNTSNSFDMKNVNYSSVDVNKRRII